MVRGQTLRGVLTLVVFTAHRATHHIIIVVSLVDSVPKRALINVLVLVAHSRCTSECLQRLLGMSADDLRESVVSLSPSFLYELHPQLILSGVAELPRTSVLAHCEVVINHYCLLSPIDKQPDLVATSTIEATSDDTGFDSIFELGQCCHS